MAFDWPTAEELLYRAMRLRRVILCGLMLPLLSVILLSFGEPPALVAERAGLAALGMTLLITGHAVLFPNATLETLALSCASSALILVMPVIRAVASLAPAEHATAALILVLAFAVVLAGVLMALLQIVLGWIVYAGPVVSLRLRTVADVPCSPSVAHRQCALQPGIRRGRLMTGIADEDGMFEVAIAAPHLIDPDAPELPQIVKVTAKVMNSTPERHDVMLILPNGSVTVTSLAFAATTAGCRITVSDLPGDFTLGMHLLFWLTDQQADNLTEMTDVILGNEARANGLAHGVSLLWVAGAILSPRGEVAGQHD